MFKFASLILILTGLIALVLFGGSMYLWYTGHWVWAILASFATFVSGSLSYTGFLLQRRIHAVTETAVEVVGKHVERVTDAVIERVKKT